MEKTACLEPVALWELGICHIFPSEGQFQSVVDGGFMFLEVTCYS
jgi:hypothetical protein